MFNRRPPPPPVVPPSVPSGPDFSGAIRSIEHELGLTIVRRGRRFEGFTPEASLDAAVRQAL